MTNMNSSTTEQLDEMTAYCEDTVRVYGAKAVKELPLRPSNEDILSRAIVLRMEQEVKLTASVLTNETLREIVVLAVADAVWTAARPDPLFHTSDTRPPANGSTYTLSELNAAVGGVISIVNVVVSPYLNWVMVINKDAYLNNQPRNDRATELFGRVIRGDVLMCLSSMVR